MAEITIGTAGGTINVGLGGYTFVNELSAANGTGPLDTVSFNVYSNIAGVKVGTFYGTFPGDGQPPTLTSRDFVELGSFSSGVVEVGGLEIDAETGDFIGIYNTTGRLALGTGGTRGRNIGDCFTGDAITFASLGSNHINLYGTGESDDGTVITVSDDGSGSDSLGAGIRASVPLTESGGGLDGAPVITVTLAVLDNGSGLDVVSRTIIGGILISLLENATGIDVVTRRIVQSVTAINTAIVNVINDGDGWMTYPADVIVSGDVTALLAASKIGTAILFTLPENIPAGRIIESAIIKLTCRDIGLPPGYQNGGIGAKSRITAALDANPSIPVDLAAYQAIRGTDVGGLNNNNRSINQIPFDDKILIPDEAIYPDDISTIIQEILDLSSPIQKILLFLDDHEGRSPPDKLYNFYEAGHDELSASLVITYRDNIAQTVMLSEAGTGTDIIALVASIIQLIESGTGADVIIRYRNADARCLGITFTAKKGKITITT